MADDEKIDPELVTLLEQRIRESGLSLRAFAETVMRREYRTVKRWADAEAPIPTLVADFLRHPSPAPWPKE